MSKIIINTTPWISLSILGLTQTLPEIYNEIIMPLGVKDEILFPDIKKTGIDELSKSLWLKFYNIKNEIIFSFAQDLDKGELEVIIAAKELSIDNVMIDEKLGRLFAKNLSLNVCGTLGYLVTLKNKNIISKIKPLITTLQENNIWISEKTKNYILTIANEK
jgi:uncharacterized protein